METILTLNYLKLNNMHQSRLTSLLFLLLTICSISFLTAQPLAPPDKMKLVENGLSAYHQIKGEPTWTIEERMKHYGVPGMSIAVIENYEVAWTKTYGVTNKNTKNPVTENTLFQAASISKPVSAYAALSFVEVGKLTLDKNINEHLTSWQLPENEITELKKVTLQNILSHTAGLTVHGFWGYSPGLEVPTLLQLLDGTKPANSDAIRVDKTPDLNFRYSGGGYCVMQQTMIDIADKNYPQIMHDQVLGPLGMTKSTFAQPLTGEQLKLAATGYIPNGNMTKGERHTYPEMAAAGLWTNAPELAKFVIDLQQTLKGKSKKVLSQEMARKMVAPVFEDFIGLGIFIRDGHFTHGGWNEGFSSNMIGHIEKGYGIVVMINANQPDFLDEVINAAYRVYDWEKGAPPAHEKLDFTSTELEQIKGKYAYTFDQSISIYQEADKVWLKYLGSKPEELIKIGENAYVRREKMAKIQFLNNPANSQLSLVFSPEKEGEPLDYKNHKMSGQEKVGLEWVMEGNLEKAVSIYKAHKSKSPESRGTHEEYINNLGYEQLQQGNLDFALNIFKLNVALYPDAFNTYDSLGEAFMIKKEYKLALENYEKSLSLNPKNENAVKMLKEIRNED